MTVIFSKKCEYGLQAVLYLTANEDRAVISAEEIAKQLSIPKEFVSKILQSLTESGIILSRKGKNGGFSLAKSPSQIKLIDIVESIDGLEVFNKCVLGFPKCSHEKPCPVHDRWGKLRTEAYAMLTNETLLELRKKRSQRLPAYNFFAYKSDKYIRYE
jgi:Rrf2 family protein